MKSTVLSTCALVFKKHKDVSRIFKEMVFIYLLLFLIVLESCFTPHLRILQLYDAGSIVVGEKRSVLVGNLWQSAGCWYRKPV